MLSLDKDLQKRKTSIRDFESVSLRVLSFLPNVLSGFEEKNGYFLYYSQSAGVKKFVRPINKKLFIMDPAEFIQKISEFRIVLHKIKSKELYFSDNDTYLIDSVLYTIQQSVGAGFDLLVDPNSARKHVGNRFEELIKAVFAEIAIPNKKVVIKIPYVTDEGFKNYTCENDLILSPCTLENDTDEKEVVLNLINEAPKVSPENDIELTSQSESLTDKYINRKEVVVSVKTTSKDRMGKMFMDKILLEKFVGYKLKVIGIFLNDVQRKSTDNISYTLVSGLFMVYNQFITELDGVYYLDPPPAAGKEPYNKHIKTFSTLITKDISRLLSS